MGSVRWDKLGEGGENKNTSQNIIIALNVTSVTLFTKSHALGCTYLSIFGQTYNLDVTILTRTLTNIWKHKFSSLFHGSLVRSRIIWRVD